MSASAYRRRSLASTSDGRLDAAGGWVARCGPAFLDADIIGRQHACLLLLSGRFQTGDALGNSSEMGQDRTFLGWLGQWDRATRIIEGVLRVREF